MQPSPYHRRRHTRPTPPITMTNQHQELLKECKKHWLFRFWWAVLKLRHWLQCKFCWRCTTDE